MARIPQKTEPYEYASDVRDWLSNNPLGTINSSERNLLENSTEVVHFPRGTFVYHQGQVRDYIYYMNSGFAVQKLYGGQGGTIALNIARPGQLLGLLGFDTDRPYLLSSQALTHVSVFRIPVETMQSVWKSSPNLIRIVSLMLMGNLVEAYEAISQSSFAKADERILRTLVKISEPIDNCENSRFIPFPITRREIAELSHTTVETTIRVLRRWENNGWLSTKKKRIILISMDYLQVSVNPSKTAIVRTI